MTHSSKPKTAGIKAGLIFLSLFTFAMGALGVFGWWSGDTDLITRLALCFGAGVTALVIPFTVIALGRSIASFAVIPVLVVCMGMQAVSFHNFVSVVIEAPHKAAFDLALQPLVDEAARTTERLDAAQASLDAVEAPVLPERCRLVACPNTIEANAKAYAAALEPKQKALNTAKADRQIAITALADARKAYKPMIREDVLWIAGGLLDIAIALAIWALETTLRKIEAEHAKKTEAKAKADARRDEQRKQAAREERAAKRVALEKAKAKAAKARPATPFVPRLVANDR